MLRPKDMEDESIRKEATIKANFMKASLLELENKLTEKAITIKANGGTVSKMAPVKKFFLMACTTKDRGLKAKGRE